MNWVELAGQLGATATLAIMFFFWFKARDERREKRDAEREKTMSGQLEAAHTKHEGTLTTVVQHNTEAMARMADVAEKNTEVTRKCAEEIQKCHLLSTNRMLQQGGD